MGEAQADKYYDALLDHFKVLTENPFLFRTVDEVREGYRRSVCGKHNVFYKISADTVEIMAIVKHENRPWTLPYKSEKEAVTGINLSRFIGYAR